MGSLGRSTPHSEQATITYNIAIDFPFWNPRTGRYRLGFGFASGRAPWVSARVRRELLHNYYALCAVLGHAQLTGSNGGSQDREARALRTVDESHT